MYLGIMQKFEQGERTQSEQVTSVHSGFFHSIQIFELYHNKRVSDILFSF